MKQYIFINAKTSSSNAWANSAEALNSIFALNKLSYDANLAKMTQDQISNLKERSQTVNIYTKYLSKSLLYKNNSVGLNCISLRSSKVSKDQPLGVKIIDLELIISSLEKYSEVYFGYHFIADKQANEIDVIAGSSYFARDPQTDRIVDVVTGVEISTDSNLDLAIWLTAYKFKNSNVYYIVTNSDLIDVDDALDIIADDTAISLIDSHNQSFKRSVLAPLVSDSAAIVGHIITTKTSSFELDVLGLSKIHIINKRVVDQAELPKFDITLNSQSLNASITGSKIRVDLGGWAVGLLSYRVNAGNSLDYVNSRDDESLQYDFVVIKI